MTPKEIREKRKALADQVQAMADKAVAEGRKLNDDEQKQWDQLNADIDGLGEQLKLSDRAEALRAEMSAPVRPEADATRLVGRDHADGRSVARDGGAPSSREEMEELRATALQAWFRCNSSRGATLTDEHERACKLVGLNPRSGELVIKLPRSDRMDKARRAGWGRGHGQSFEGAEQRALSALVGASGGFTIPETLINQLEVNMLAFGGMLQSSETIRTASGETITWPTADDTSNSGRQLGESAAVTTTDPAFGAVTWGAYKFSSDEIKVPTELIEDSVFDVASVIGAMLGERLGRILNTKFTTGTGAGTPKGLLTCATTGVTCASTSAFTWDEMTNLVHSVDPAYRTGGAWMFHDNTALAARKLKDGIGRPLWQDGPNGTPPPTLMGYPYFINQDMDSSLATGDTAMVFGQLNKYKVRQVNEIRLYRLIERHRENDQDAFVAFIRADGNLLTAGTVPVKKMLMA